MKIIHPIALAVLSVLLSAYTDPGSSTKSVVVDARPGASHIVVSSILSVSPTSLSFGPTPLNTFAYAMVTISNTGDAADCIAGASPFEGTFFATFGGTCNFSIDPDDSNQRNYWIPAGGSCTFQWGYHPTPPVGGGKPPWTQTGTGTLTFDSNAPISIPLTGIATPH